VSLDWEELSEDWEEMSEDSEEVSLDSEVVSKDSEGVSEHLDALSELSSSMRLDSTTNCRRFDTTFEDNDSARVLTP
jgi:hypothetical protein